MERGNAEVQMFHHLKSCLCQKHSFKTYMINKYDKHITLCLNQFFGEYEIQLKQKLSSIMCSDEDFLIIRNMYTTGMP